MVLDLATSQEKFNAPKRYMHDSGVWNDNKPFQYDADANGGVKTGNMADYCAAMLPVFTLPLTCMADQRYSGFQSDYPDLPLKYDIQASFRISMMR